MSDERRAEIEAVARALHEQGFGFNIDADPVARESMFSVARVVLDRLRDARGDDEAEIERLNRALDNMRAEYMANLSAAEGQIVALRAARSPQGEPHEAGIEAAAAAMFVPPISKDRIDDVRAGVAAYLARVSAPKADEKQEAP